MITRIKEIISRSGLSERGFAIFCEMKIATFNRQMSGTGDVSIAVVNQILEHFPEISAEWLLFGTGNMLLQKNSNVEALLETIQALKQTILEKSVTITALTTELNSVFSDDK